MTAAYNLYNFYNQAYKVFISVRQEAIY